jgi:hypothetical protein
LVSVSHIYTLVQYNFTLQYNTVDKVSLNPAYGMKKTENMASLMNILRMILRIIKIIKKGCSGKYKILN